jgi:V/A-type H+-transporting ATPase subunit E
MGIEQIISRIVDEAREETTKIRSEYDSKVDKMKSIWDEERTMRLEALEEELKAITDREMSRQIIAEKLEAKKRLLAIKRKLVDQAFDMARKEFLTIEKDKYLPIMANIVATSALTGEETVVLSIKDNKEIGKDVIKAANEIAKNLGLKGSLTLGEPSSELDGGAILQQNNVEIRRTVDELILEVRENIEGKVLKALFKEEK